MGCAGCSVRACEHEATADTRLMPGLQATISGPGGRSAAPPALGQVQHGRDEFALILPTPGRPPDDASSPTPLVHQPAGSPTIQRRPPDGTFEQSLSFRWPVRPKKRSDRRRRRLNTRRWGAGRLAKPPFIAITTRFASSNPHAAISSHQPAHRGVRSPCPVRPCDPACSWQALQGQDGSRQVIEPARALPTRASEDRRSRCSCGWRARRAWGPPVSSASLPAASPPPCLGFRPSPGPSGSLSSSPGFPSPPISHSPILPDAGGVPSPGFRPPRFSVWV